MTAPVPHPTAGFEAAQRLLSRSPGGPPPFTALACHNDPLAVGALRAFKAAGLHVPGDVSLTGFDDVSRDYRVRPAITSVGFDRHAMGRRAVEILCELLGEPAASRQETFPVQLAVRQSSAKARPLS
jgi:DNA-binding LacI/PurR family transcriptional regulator